jgi:hypothetical protein
MAQSDAKATARWSDAAAKVSEADEAKTRANSRRRARLDKARTQVAELSMQLGNEGGPNFVSSTTAVRRRAVLGVQIDPASGKEGARLMSVSPGGAAEKRAARRRRHRRARRQGHRRRANPNRAVVDYMRDVKPDQKVKVRVLRAGKNKDFVVVARPMIDDGSADFNCRSSPGGAMGAVIAPARCRRSMRVPHFWPASSSAWNWRASRRSSVRTSAPPTACWWCRRRRRGLQARGWRRDPGHRRPQAGRRRARHAHPAFVQAGEKLSMRCCGSASP